MKKRIFIVIPALLLFGCHKGSMEVEVLNTTGSDRKAEMIEIPVQEITARISNASLNEIIVIDKSGNEIPSQLLYEGNKAPVKLLFEADVPASAEKTYVIKNGISQQYKEKVYGRFVPERMDDYTWENDRIAFRIYGTALIKKDGPSNGLDVWVKRTDMMIVNIWYSEYLTGKNSYHDDNGTGCDCYKVGRTLGAGAMAPYVNDSLWLGINFSSYKTLDNGPLRTSFKLFYPPFDVDGTLVTETRTISLDAGSQLNMVTEEYKGIDRPFDVAAGIVLRPEGLSKSSSSEKGYIIYSQDAGESGIIYLGTVLSSPSKEIIEEAGHLLIKSTYTPGEKLTYYTGAGWSKWGFENEEAWIKYIEDYSARIRNPLKVTFK